MNIRRRFLFSYLSLVISVVPCYAAQAVKPTCRVRPADQTPGFYAVLSSRVGEQIPADHRPFEKSVALIVAVEDYTSIVPSLEGNRTSAQNLANYFYDTEGFDEVCTLFDRDATRYSIEHFILNDLAPRLTSKDRFLFVFSGHGANAPTGRTGYMLLADAGANDFAHDVIENVMIGEWSSQLPVANALFVLDSCSSGFGANIVAMGVPAAKDLSNEERILGVFAGLSSRNLWTAATAKQSTYFVQNAPIFTDCWRASLASLRNDGPLQGLHPSKEVFAATSQCVTRWVAEVCRQKIADCNLTPQETPIGGPVWKGDFLFLGQSPQLGPELRRQLGVSTMGAASTVTASVLEFFGFGSRVKGPQLGLSGALVAKGSPFSARVAVKSVARSPVFVSVEGRAPFIATWDGGTSRVRLLPGQEAAALLRTDPLTEPVTQQIQFRVADSDDALAVATDDAVVDLSVHVDVQESIVRKEYQSDPTPSGVGKAFGAPGNVCMPRTFQNYELLPDTVEYSLSGDRRCGAWSTCQLVPKPDAMCLSFSLQGHDELPGGGVRYSVGHIAGKYAPKPTQPRFQAVRRPPP